MKKIVTIIFALMMTIALWAYDFKSGDLYYNITSSSEPYTVEVTYQYNWSETNYSSLTTVVIPESVTRNGATYSVTSIGENAFYDCQGLTSVTIPNSVTTIGERAFSSCYGLTSVTIPTSVTSIGKQAFAYCRNMTAVVWNAINCADFSYSSMEGPFGDQRNNSAITSFTFGDSVQHIPAYLCYGMTKLTSVTIPNSVTSIGTQAFYECSGLTSPVYNAHCFAYMPSCSGAYTIPEGIKQISGWAFAYCRSLTSITIPKSVTSIGDDAFRMCSGLTSVVWNAINCTSSAPFETYSGGYLTSITFGDSVQHIPASICSGMTKLTSVTISNSVTSIGNAAFRGCHSLTSPVYNAHCFAYMPASYEGAYVIPEGIKQIAGSAFYGCSELTSVTIPNSVTSIGEYAFYNCSGLTSVTIPNSVTGIGGSAFYGCSELTFIESWAEIPPTLKNYVFYNVSATIPVYVSCGKVTEYQSAEGWKEFSNIQEPLAEHSIAVGVNDSIMGTAKVDENTICGAHISATANYGYHFTQWSDGNTENPRALQLTQDTILTAEFAINQYSITTTSSHSERGTTQGDTIVNYLERVTISATANYGYHFAQWNDRNTENPRVVQVTKDKAYEAQFDKNIYKITTYCNNQMGSVSAPKSAEYLDQVTISATAKYGYHFVQWNDGNIDNPRALVLTQDTTFTAEFAPNQYSITTNSANPDRGTTQGDTLVNYLEKVTISATANYGYHFAQWNDRNTENPRVVQVTEDKTYTAQFDKNIYSVTTYCNNNQMGSVNAPESAEYLDQVTISATASYGYHFVQWNDGITDNPRAIVLTQDTTLTAEFAHNQYSITTTSSHSERGTTQGDTTVNYLEDITISATANYGYHFAKWNDGNTDNPRVVQATEDKTYTAQFDKNIYSVTTDCNNNQMGSVNAPESAEYLDQVTISATASYGYHFVQWNDGNTDNPRALVLTQDTTFTAEFTQTYSGQCGDSLYWQYDSNTLTITGTGAMYDERPWGLLAADIKKVSLPTGLTHIGNDAFKDCNNLRQIDIPYTIESIGSHSFNGCNRLIHINCYPILPPSAEQSSFSNYNVNLYAPCDNLDDYRYHEVFGSFKYFECIGSESTTTDGVVVTPGSTDVEIVWPTDEDAATYTIIIMKDGQVFCRLTFDENGKLLNIAFAPSRNGMARAPYAELTSNGLRFTVTGLTAETKYGYDVSTKDEDDNTISSYTGEFTTKSDVVSSVSDTQSPTSNSRKTIRNAQLIIIVDGVEYDAQGRQIGYEVIR